MEKCLEHIRLLKGLHQALVYTGHFPNKTAPEVTVPHADTDRRMLTLEQPIRRTYEALERFHDWHERVNSIEKEIHPSYINSYARHGRSYRDDYIRALDSLLAQPLVATIEDKIGSSRFVAVIQEVSNTQWLDDELSIMVNHLDLRTHGDLVQLFTTDDEIEQLIGHTDQTRTIKAGALIDVEAHKVNANDKVYCITCRAPDYRMYNGFYLVDSSCIVDVEEYVK